MLSCFCRLFAFAVRRWPVVTCWRPARPSAARYTFSHIFGAETDQRQLFRRTTMSHVTEFVNGRSCLIFTYGATNSGKTHTVQGGPRYRAASKIASLLLKGAIHL